MKTNIFKYSTLDIQCLKSKDKTMSNLIDKIGDIKREVNLEPFQALLAQIIGQQISMKAAQTIWSRIETKISITPSSILEHTEDIRACGVSYRKIGYMQNIANAVINKNLNLERINKLTDTEIIEKLVQFPGFGVWSAEMFLIFCLNRPNVLSYGDFAIKKALMKLYNLPEMNKNIFQTYYELFSPHASLASLYLWESNRL